MPQKFKISHLSIDIKLVLILTLIIFFNFSEKSFAKNELQSRKEPIAFTADEIIHDKELGIMKASWGFHNPKFFVVDYFVCGKGDRLLSALKFVFGKAFLRKIKKYN